MLIKSIRITVDTIAKPICPAQFSQNATNHYGLKEQSFKTT